MPVDSSDDIDKIVYNLLRESKCYGIFPTPVDKIIKYADLVVDQDIDLRNVKRNFFQNKLEWIEKILRKVRGAIHIGSNTIYLDQSLHPMRKRFVQLHETGHAVLPWQRATFSFVDDDGTLDLDTKRVFEQQANYFASSALWQVDIFEEEAKRRKLSVASALEIIEKIGGSIYSGLRRYVEFSHRRCALIVLEQPTNSSLVLTNVGSYFSSTFKDDFGDIKWPKYFDTKWPFVTICGTNTQDIGEGKFDFNGDTFNYQTFNNSYNLFVFVVPPGEKLSSSKKVILNT